MKKIAFFVQHMLCGGIENALITLTRRLVEKGYDVTVYVIAERGDFLAQIPKDVHLKKIPLPKEIECKLPVGGTRFAVQNSFQERQYKNAIFFLVRRVLKRGEFAELQVDFGKIPVLKEKYDIGVNYQMHSPFLVRYLSEKVQAERKLSWIHNDFVATGYHIQALKPELECCERFFGVSRKIVEEFAEIFPEYQERIFLAHNLIPTSEIYQKANTLKAKEYMNVPRGCLKLLTVGRLEEQKGYDIALRVCRKLKDVGDNFRWFVLGDGTQRKQLERQCRKLGLKQEMCFLGIRENPYPYFKDCDIYVQTSRHEGWGITITEAKLFRLPILCTDVSGSIEQIEDEANGEVVPVDVDCITKRLHRLIREPDRREMYREMLAHDMGQEEEEWLSVFDD